jgi:hypothetical protein
MDEFESTIAGNAPTSRVSVVYDPRDGRIVYTHEVIGGGRDTAAAKADREKVALASAAKHRPDVAGVRVLHLADGFRREPEKRYRVDAKAGRLVVQAASARQGDGRRAGPADDPAAATPRSPGRLRSPRPTRAPRPTRDQPRAKPRSQK